MTAPTTPANLARINKMYVDLTDLMSSLYGRWLDEAGYEDLDDYMAVLKKRMPKGFVITKMTARPFGFIFNIGTDAEYAITINSTQYKWLRRK